jgi:FemAB-related protein (PEP-CTERM system-associated)
MRVDLLTKEEETEWDNFVLGSGGATLFHLTGWKRTVERTFGFEAKYLLAKEGDHIRGILPLFRVPVLPFGNCLISVPYGVYAGICAEDHFAENALLEAAVSLMNVTNTKYLELRHIKGIEGPLQKKDRYSTFRRSIFPTEEANMSAIPRKERAEIRKGKRNGLTSQIGSIEYLDGFYDIYAHSVRKLGSPVFHKDLFRNIISEFPDHCRILTVWHEKKMVAGVLSLFFRNQVMPYYGGSLGEFLSLSVNDVMYWDLMCYGMENGYEVFDFGRSKNGTGAYKFKEHWGFHPEPLEYQYYLTHGMQLPDWSPANPKFSLAISLWKKLPLSLTKILGPPITRYFP